jgi:lactate racemase
MVEEYVNFFAVVNFTSIIEFNLTNTKFVNLPWFTKNHIAKFTMNLYRKKMELKYGNTSFVLDLRPERISTIIQLSDQLIGSSNPKTVVAAAIEKCSDLVRSFRSGDRVVIVTSDITRYTGSELYLPLLIDKLNSIGIRDEDIEILIALGIHRKQSDLEHEKIVGPIYGRIRVVDHDCDDQNELVCLGKTSSGIAVELNRRVVDTDRLILTGSIGFHYFAGFGGGRKSILPGLASRKTCMASHFAVLNPGKGTGKNPLAITANLEGNPVHQAMMEACSMVKPDMLLNTVITPEKRVNAAFSGDWREAHIEGCSYYEERFSIPIKEKADLVIVSCGGFPKDINFIQAHKSMEFGSQALREGGAMILLAQCRDGYGHPGFFKWFRFDNLNEFEAELRLNYEINGQTAYSVMQKCKRFRIYLVSDLPPKEVVSMGMTPFVSLAEAIEQVEEILPKDYICHVLPDGGVLLPVLKKHLGKWPEI